MALNVPIAMLMSLLVAFTITPWLSLPRSQAGRIGEGHEARRSCWRRAGLYRAYSAHHEAALRTARPVAGRILGGCAHSARVCRAGSCCSQRCRSRCSRSTTRTSCRSSSTCRKARRWRRPKRRRSRLADYLVRVPEVTDVSTYVGHEQSRWISTAWCATTICARGRTSRTCASIWSARSCEPSRATPSRCGSETTSAPSPDSTGRTSRSSRSRRGRR